MHLIGHFVSSPILMKDRTMCKTEKKLILWLSEALLMSIHNICFHGEIRKIRWEDPLLTGAMKSM